MFRSKFSAPVLMVLAMTGAGHAWAGGGGIAGATEPTQILNNLQLLTNGMEEARTAMTVAQQYQTQIQQYQTQVANLASLSQLPAGLLGDAGKAVADLTNFRGALQRLTGSISQQKDMMERRLTEARLSGTDWKSYVNSVAAEAAHKNQRAIQRLEYEESVVQQVQADYAFARNLQSQIPATVGQHQAMQLMNSQMNRVVTQNAKLLEVYSTTLAQQTEKDAREAEAMAKGIADQDLLRQHQEAISKRQRAFGGFQ